MIIALPITAGAAPITPGTALNFCDFGVVVGDAGGLVDEDVRGGPENARLQLALQPGHQRERDDERHHADGDAERRHERDDGDEDLPAFGQKVAERDL